LIEKHPDITYLYSWFPTAEAFPNLWIIHSKMLSHL